jgi:uncharacterized repeat protein (TIGR01451 family)
MLLRSARLFSWLLLLALLLSHLPTSLPSPFVGIPGALAAPAAQSQTDPIEPPQPTRVDPPAAVDPRLPALTLDVAIAPDPIAVGETAALTVTVRNLAPNPATNLVVTLPTPDGALALSGPTTLTPVAGWRWTLARLEGNATADLTGSLRLVRMPQGNAVLLQPLASADGVTVPAAASGGALATVRETGNARFTPGVAATLRSADNRVEVRVPPGAFRRALNLRARGLAEALTERQTRGLPLPPPLANGRRVFGPFVLDAADDTGADIHQFDAPLTISVTYTPEQLQAFGIPAGELRLFWFDEAARGWTPLPTSVDTEARTVSAPIDHFSVFTIGDGLSPSTAFIPTLQGFQVSSFTGAASYSELLDVPAGPGGLAPNLELSYSSAASDGTAGERGNWQASWVGKGWSLDPAGSVSLNKSVAGDSWNSFSFVFGGRSFQVTRGQPSGVKPGGGACTVNDVTLLECWTWHAVDEQFARVRVSYKGDVTVGTAPNTATYRTYIWHAWTKDGTRYDFGLNDNQLWWTNDLSHREVYKWLLVKVTDPHGNKIVYDYQIDAISRSLNNVVADYHPSYALLRHL